MNKIEALELELAARKMVKGTGLDWTAVIRHHSKRNLADRVEEYSTADVELALGIVEGMQAWKGDTAYWTDNRGETCQIVVGRLNNFNCPGWSWNPPAPKTVMVELTVEDAEYYADETEISIMRVIKMIARRAEACRKALEGLK